jgi:urease accessory protein
MLIQQKMGCLSDWEVGSRKLDYLPLEWYETDKRILHKNTWSGRALHLRFLSESPQLTQDDVLWVDESSLVVVDLVPAETIVLQPGSRYQVAAICYEIGNKHLPLFYDQEELLVPFDAPFFRLLQAAGYQPRQEQRKLLHRLKTTVLPHGHDSSKSSGSGESLFSRIMHLTTSAHAKP